jgi:hypothetical protein
MSGPGYIVMTASATMPAMVKARYRRVAVCLVADVENPPKFIGRRARGMIEITQTWERLNVGCNVRSAYTRALARAQVVCDAMNAYRAELVSKLGRA